MKNESEAESIVLPQPAMMAAVAAVRAYVLPHEPHDFKPPASHPPLQTHHNLSLALIAVLVLALGVAGIAVGGRYWSSHVLVQAQPLITENPTKPTIAGLNLTVPAAQLDSRVQTITGQPATLTVGTQTVPISADTIKSWLQITTNRAKTEDYIRIKSGAMETSLNQLANQFVKAPVNTVTIPEDGVNHVVVGGRNGTSLTDPADLKTQADQVAKSVMDGSGLKFSTTLQTQAFQAVGPTAFSKLLVTNVSTKKMWAFQNGQEVNSWLISAGKPSTPTPLGQFHVYAKYAVQDMRGFNPDGTPYFQPSVPWVNYFYQGSAVHGVYWHPLSWFGANNSSHGCVGLPVDEAHWVYDWAPIGTTVITHA